MREIHDLSFDIDRFLEDAVRAKQQLDVERECACGDLPKKRAPCRRR